MSQAEADAFEAEPGFDVAVRLRRFDELGKVEGVQLAPIAAYRDLLMSLASRG